MFIAEIYWNQGVRKRHGFMMNRSSSNSNFHWAINGPFNEIQLYLSKVFTRPDRFSIKFTVAKQWKFKSTIQKFDICLTLVFFRQENFFPMRKILNKMIFWAMNFLRISAIPFRHVRNGYKNVWIGIEKISFFDGFNRKWPFPVNIACTKGGFLLDEGSGYIFLVDPIRVNLP